MTFPNANVRTVTEATFESEVIQSEIPVLIDLYADWCAPCKVLAPRVEAVAREYAGRLKVVKVNTDDSPQIAKAFRATSIPMLVLISEGRPVGVLRGAVSREEIVALVEQAVAPSAGPSGIKNVKPQELAKLIKGQQVQVIDVREKAPYNRAHIPSALNIMTSEILEKLPEIASARKPVIVYDRSLGDDAKAALEIFAQEGYPAAGLEGGILAWEGDGLDIERTN
ncbi:MAG: thioredoxin domain-containing protein [Deltaproteobacteria bacterium]|nr:thioredoxin domain-containing protein [Deltaproteobacteria bacterium]